MWLEISLLVLVLFFLPCSSYADDPSEMTDAEIIAELSLLVERQAGRLNELEILLSEQTTTLSSLRQTLSESQQSLKQANTTISELSNYSENLEGEVLSARRWVIVLAGTTLVSLLLAVLF